jgi:hypothetical protein
MTNLNSLNRRYITDNATATAADIESGKTAYINGGKVTGTGVFLPADTSGGILLDYCNPVGVVDASFNASLEGAAIVQASAITDIASNVYNLSSDGYATPTTAWGTYVQTAGGSLPSKTTTTRLYQMYGKTANAALTISTGVRIVFNYLDGNNYWDLAVRAQAGQFEMYLFEYTAGVGNVRGGTQLSGGMGYPTFFDISIYDGGDDVNAYCTMYEQDNLTADNLMRLHWNASSRPNQSETGIIFGTHADATDEWFIRGCRIMEM